MKRTPPWVFVAAVGVQLAALCLCLWAMELSLRAHDEEEAPEPPPPPPDPPEPRPAARRAALAAAPPPSPADVAFASRPARPPNRRPKRAGPPEPELSAPPPAPEAEPAPFPEPPPPPRQVTVRAVQRPPEPPTSPLFGPPPERLPEIDRALPFIVEAADATTQIVRGRVGDRAFVFGFYPDGNMRFVDVDGARYAGRVESARARLREIDGMRAFTVQIGVNVDQKLEATFTGGMHDGETIALEPLVGWSVA